MRPYGKVHSLLIQYSLDRETQSIIRLVSFKRLENQLIPINQNQNWISLQYQTTCSNVQYRITAACLVILILFKYSYEINRIYQIHQIDRTDKNKIEISYNTKSIQNCNKNIKRAVNIFLQRSIFFYKILYFIFIISNFCKHKKILQIDIKYHIFASN